MVGVEIALLQPAKTQIYTEDVQWVKDECPTLAYLEESLASVNGPRRLATTSVFDAFPFITEPISSEGLSKEATDAYKGMRMLSTQDQNSQLNTLRHKLNSLNVFKLDEILSGLRLLRNFHQGAILNCASA